MAKTKTPFLSLGAHGSIGDTITAQKRGRETMLRKKPIPADPQSDAQLRHRSLFLATCQLWNGLSALEKRAWNSTAVRFHYTGFNLFQHTYIATLKDLSLYLPLNELGGAVAQDFSYNLNHATIIGATRAAGRFGNALSFDGLNDYVRVPNHPSLNYGGESFEIEVWINFSSLAAGTDYVINKTMNGGRGFQLYTYSDGRGFDFFYNNGLGYIEVYNQPGADVSRDEWHLIHGSYSKPLDAVFLHIDTILIGSNNIYAVVGGQGAVTDLIIGSRFNLINHLKGMIDEPKLYPRLLTQQERELHFNRGTPP